jgi:hypothetical protein
MNECKAVKAKGREGIYVKYDNEGPAEIWMRGKLASARTREFRFPSALWLSSKNSITRNLCPLNKLRLSRRSVGERCWMKNEIIDFGVLDA